MVRVRRSVRIRRVDLKKTLFVLPNLVTLGSVFCGVSAIHLATRPDLTPATLVRGAQLILLAMLFDLLDGRVARLTRTQSAFGLQLDSLADIVSFGVAPAVLAYAWGLSNHPSIGLFSTFFYVAAGAVRLARFNVLAATASGEPSRPGRYMVGLPIPAAAGMLVSLIMTHPTSTRFSETAGLSAVPAGVLFLLGLLMVSTIPFRSFKDLALDRPTVLLAFFLVATSSILWVKFQLSSVVVWLLLVYLFLGLFEGVRLLLRRSGVLPKRNPTIPPS